MPPVVPETSSHKAYLDLNPGPDKAGTPPHPLSLPQSFPEQLPGTGVCRSLVEKERCKQAGGPLTGRAGPSAGLGRWGECQAESEAGVGCPCSGWGEGEVL